MSWSLSLMQSTQLLSVAAPLAFLIYSGVLAIHRLYFHPLSKVPGPKLAAITQWVEIYYNCFKRPGGQFMWVYQEWHIKYGPIVRIGPNEVHIQDPYFYDVLYSQSRHVAKLKHLNHRFNNELSAFATVEHDYHRMRRGALNPFFSKKKISEYAPNIQSHMNRLCTRVTKEIADTGAVLTANNMWGAFTADIVVGFSLERPYNFILKPDFRAEFADSMVDLLNGLHIVTHFPWTIKSLLKLPDWLIVKLSPPMRSVIDFNNEMTAQISEAKKAHAAGQKLEQHERQSVFTALLQSDLPDSELSDIRLQHEAIAIIAAGMETTMNALSTCTYHLLMNPNSLVKLKSELVSAIPDPASMPSLDTLLQLPFLTCVINESLRLSYGVVQRIPRLCPTPVNYTAPDTEYTIPVGAILSMDNYSVSHDESIFPESREFHPERWEGNPVAPDGKPLTKYLVAFGRGTRNCVGMQLAYAEFYIGLATFWRRYDCELFETGRDAVDCYMDQFVSRPKPGTKGVRIKVWNAV